jgi:Na+-driven multidrug efflux pump
MQGSDRHSSRSLLDPVEDRSLAHSPRAFQPDRRDVTVSEPRGAPAPATTTAPGAVDPAPLVPPTAAESATSARAPYDRSIVEGPLGRAVWRIAWPTMLQNVIGGLQGIIDHAMVGHYVGYTGNAAIGVSWQIFLVVVVFISSLFTGMACWWRASQARATRTGEPHRVPGVPHGARLSLFVLAPIGYVLTPSLLGVVNATPEVQAEALPYLRIMFVFSAGMLLFFMLGGALRSAGDARTPLRLGVVVTVLNIVLNVVLIRGLGPIPAFGTAGAAMGTVIATGGLGVYALFRALARRLGGSFPRRRAGVPDWEIIRALFRFGLPTGIAGNRDERRRA